MALQQRASRSAATAASRFYLCFFDVSTACSRLYHVHSARPRAYTRGLRTSRLPVTQYWSTQYRLYITTAVQREVARDTKPNASHTEEPIRVYNPAASAVDTPSPYTKPQPATSTKNATVDATDLSSHMRALMRLVPHPVTVITAAAPSSSLNPSVPTESTFCGMTVSSFNSVTLTPKPIVSFNVKTPSATYTALKSTGYFLAHIMSSSQFGAFVAEAFARGNGPQVFAKLSEEVKSFEVFVGRATRDAPMIAGEGVLKVLRCKVLEGKEVGVGDHVVVLGEVEGLLGDQRGLPGTAGGRTGLVYVDRMYRTVGSAVEDRLDDQEDSLPGRRAKTPGGSIEKTIGLNVRRGDEGFGR